jgi:hypothetical protein
MDLKTYLLSMPMAERITFSVRCRTTYGHLRNISYGQKPCSAELAMEVERESSGAVRCEELCPEADWATVRGTCRDGQHCPQAAA